MSNFGTRVLMVHDEDNLYPIVALFHTAPTVWDNLILYSRSKLLEKHCPEAIELSSVCLHSS